MPDAQPTFNVFDQQNIYNGGLLGGDQTFGIPSNCPMFNNQSNSLTAMNAQDIIQDGGLSNIPYNTIRASAIEADFISGTQLYIGQNFSVNSSGVMTAKAGTIGGFTITSNQIIGYNSGIPTILLQSS